MPNHYSSSVLSRRQFLKGLLALGGLACVADWEAMATATVRPGWREPIWVLSLKDNRLLSPQNMPVPNGLPGSLMKLVAATALLEEKLVSPDETLACCGTLHLDKQTFHCEHAHGKLAIREAIGLSCNLFFAQAAMRLSIRRFLQYAEKFRLHQPVHSRETFIFPGETTNSEPSQSYVLGLNRNLQPNATQLARMASIIAQRQIPGIKPQTWEILQSGMRLAVTQGTASELDRGNKLHIAAKTGTTRHGHTFQSWLAGYFPWKNPRYAFCVRSLAGTSRESAVPVASRFLLSRSWD